MPVETIRHHRITWTNIVHVTSSDVEQLHLEYPHFHPLNLEDLLSTIERPKLDVYDDYLFVVFQFPVYDPTRRMSRPAEVDMFMGSGYLIMAHDGKLPPLEKLFHHCQNNDASRERLMAHGASRLFHEVIDNLVDYLFPMLYKVDTKIHHLEEAIFQENERRIVQELTYVRRDIIALRRIVQPQVEILHILEQIDRPYIREELDVYFDDILDHLKKASDMITYHGEIVYGLLDTANTLANLHTNNVIRILTIFSVIMLPLTLVTSLYGMNVSLPLQNHHITFSMIMLIMLAIAGGMLAYFRRNGWL